MIKKSTIALMALMVLIVVISGCTDNKNNTPNNTQNISNQTQNNTNYTNNTTNSSIKTPAEAKLIAEQFINDPSVTAGTPVLNTVNGRQIYVVPLYRNGEAVGEIELDAKTGENLGGAGGAP